LEVERAKWPKSGLDFAEQLLQTIKLNAGSCLGVCRLQQSVTNKYCKELVVMTNSLRELKQLKEKHKISVALADFMQV
jgi:predicted aconitase